MAFFSKVKFWKKDEKDKAGQEASQEAEAQETPAQEEEYGPQSIGRPKQAEPAPGAMPPPVASPSMPGSMPPPASSPMPPPVPAAKPEPTPAPETKAPEKAAPAMPAAAPRREEATPVEAKQDMPGMPPVPEALPEPVVESVPETVVTPEPVAEPVAEPIIEPEPEELPDEAPMEPEAAPAPPVEAKAPAAPKPEPVAQPVVEPEPEELPEEAPMEPEAAPAPPEEAKAPEAPKPEPVAEPIIEPEPEELPDEAPMEPEAAPAPPVEAKEPEPVVEPIVEPEPEELPDEAPMEPEAAPAPPVEAKAPEAPKTEPIAEPIIEPEPEELSDEAPMEPEAAPAPPVETKAPEAPQPEPLAEPVVEPEPEELSDEAPMEPEAAPAPEPAPDRPRMEPWQEELLLNLRDSEPKLSVWLEHVLAGVEEAGELLWQRLGFFFTSLEVPAQEAEDFIGRFRDWLEDMEYEYIDEFRSELQYRLALALDLEDEEDERSRLFIKLNEGLSKTKEKITKQIDGLVAGHTALDEDFWEGLEEILIMADVGYEAAMMLVERLREAVRREGITDPADFKGVMQREMAKIFETPKRITAVNPPEVVLLVGVNGAGKTTTVAKLAHRAQMQGRRVLVAAGDTFRAAAMEQLEVWSKRVGAGFFSKGAKADPAAVAYEAVDRAVREGYDMIFMDTAGRLHTKVDLMDELRKIRNVLGKRHPGAPHRTILVLDATTGQNALQQVKLFGEAVEVDEIILTKLDGTAKGGVIAAVAIQYGKPISFIGLGEKMEDLRPFNGEDFAAALLG
jgi:fused signal recognition particle receptor